MGASAIKAIPTRYKGYHFRSRLEARWAVFFDAMGLKWEYEPEGFDLDGELYLPDFRVWTPQGEPCWYEVKPEGVVEDPKFSLFRKHVLASMPERIWHRAGNDYGARVTLLSGDPKSHIGSNCWPCSRCGSLQGYKHELEPIIREHQGELANWQYCGPCDYEMSVSGEIGTGVADVPYRGQKGTVCTPFPGFGRLVDVTMSAMKAARSARFEHGESGAT